MYSPDFFDYVGKRLDKKAIVYFKVYDITGRTANNYNGYIAKNKAERLAPDLLFFKKKKKRFKIKARVFTLVLIYFGSHRLGYTIKTNL